MFCWCDLFSSQLLMQVIHFNRVSLEQFASDSSLYTVYTNPSKLKLCVCSFVAFWRDWIPSGFLLSHVVHRMAYWGQVKRFGFLMVHLFRTTWDELFILRDSTGHLMALYEHKALSFLFMLRSFQLELFFFILSRHKADILFRLHQSGEILESFTRIRDLGARSLELLVKRNEAQRMRMSWSWIRVEHPSDLFSHNCSSIS